MYLSSLFSRSNTCTSLQFLPCELMFVVHSYVSAHIRFFQLCIVSSVLALSAHANTHISSSHTHTRVRASARRRVCVHFLSPGRLLLLFIYAGISLICLWHSAQPSGCASRVLLTGPENRFASGRGFDSTIRRVRNEQQDLNELYSIFLYNTDR